MPQSDTIKAVLIKSSVNTLPRKETTKLTPDKK